MTATVPKKLPHYKIAGRKLLSVTTILDMIAKPALVGWAGKEAALAALEFVTEKWDRVSPITEAQVTLWKNAHRRTSGSAAEIGTEMHLAMDAYMTGAAYTGDRLIALAGKEVATNLMTAGRNAVEGLGLKLVEPGRTVCSAAHGVAGTFDTLVVMRDGGPFVVDYKTSGSIWPEMSLQVSAYAKLIGEMGQPIPRRAVLRLDKKSGAYEWSEITSDLDSDFEVFLAARRLYVWAHGDPDKARR